MKRTVTFKLPGVIVSSNRGENKVTVEIDVKPLGPIFTNTAVESMELALGKHEAMVYLESKAGEIEDDLLLRAIKISPEYLKQ